MKRISSLSLLLITALSLVAPCAFASAVAYPFRVTDNSGVLLSGATVKIGTTTLTSGSATTVPTSAGEKVLSTNAAPASTVSVTLLDYGTGDYALVYDTSTQGEMYFPLTITKSGSTITNGNALIALVASADSSNEATAATQATTAATQATSAATQTTASNQQANATTALTTLGYSSALATGLGTTNTTVGTINTNVNTVSTNVNSANTSIAALPTASAITNSVWAAGTRTITGGTITTYTGNTPQTGDSYARLGAPTGASTAADIASVKTSVGTPQQAGSPVTLPTTAPTGYGGSSSDSSGVTTLLTRIPAAISFTGGNVNAATQNFPATVTVGTNNDKTGYSLTSAPPTVSQIAAGILTTPANTLSTNVSGQVVASSVAGNVTGSVGSVTGSVGSVTGSVASVTGSVGSVTGNVGGSVASVTSGVTVSTNNDKTGYALTSGEHTNIAGDVLSATASSYNTAGTIGQKINTTGSASDPWTATLPGSYSAGQAGYIVGHNIDALISSRSTYAGTDTTGVTTLLSRLPSALSFTAGNVNAITNAYANGQDPASLVWNYNVGGTAGSLLASKAEAFAAATAAGSYLVGTLNTVAHTQTNTYYLPNTTLSAMNAGTATVIGTVLVTYDTSNTHILSRVYTPGSF